MFWQGGNRSRGKALLLSWFLNFITACKRKSSPAPRPDDLAESLGKRGQGVTLGEGLGGPWVLGSIGARGMGENHLALQAIARPRLSPKGQHHI